MKPCQTTAASRATQPPVAAVCSPERSSRPRFSTSRRPGSTRGSDHRWPRARMGSPGARVATTARCGPRVAERSSEHAADRCGRHDVRPLRHGRRGARRADALPRPRPSGSRSSAAPFRGSRTWPWRPSGSSRRTAAGSWSLSGMPGKAADRQGLRPRGVDGDHAGPAHDQHPDPRGLRPRGRGGRPGAPGRGLPRPGPQARPQRLLDALRARAAGWPGPARASARATPTPAPSSPPAR